MPYNIRNIVMIRIFWYLNSIIHVLKEDEEPELEKRLNS